MNKLQSLWLGLVSLALSTSALADTDVDGIPTALPEPGTLGLLVAGLVGVFALRRFGRK